MSSEVGVTCLVHGESGVGKSWLGASAPAPRLLLDVESRSRFLPGKKILWDPRSGGPPEKSNEWDTCIVSVDNFEVIGTVHQWLVSGQHPFRSVVLDSITEAQKRLVDSIAGMSQMKIQDYGTLLRRLESVVRTFRDLTADSRTGIKMVVFLAGSKTIDGMIRPLVQGQLALTIPYYTDITGYMYVAQVAEESGLGGATVRQLLINPAQGVVAKDGTGGRLTGPVLTNPDLTEMFQALQADQVLIPDRR